MTFINPQFLRMLKEQSAVPDGIHGPSHWARVLANGRRLTPITGANLKVVELFAVLHDSQRLNDGHDPEHGPRAAEYALTLRGEWFDIDDEEMALLCKACRGHTGGHAPSEPTIGTCWDADRLDLGRVGIRPDPDLLCTEAARMSETIEWARIQRYEQKQVSGVEAAENYLAKNESRRRVGNWWPF